MITFKSIFLGISILLFNISLSAQSIAIKGGLNFSKISYSAPSNSPIEDEGYLSTNYRTGFNLGITTSFPISGLLSFETGLIYQERGYINKFSQEELGEPYSYEINAQLIYLDIPFSLKASFDLGEFEAYVFGGGYAGIGAGGSGESTSVIMGMSETQSGDVEF